MTQKLEERKKELQTLLQQKITQMQNAESVKNQVTTEVIELQGKIKMIDELIAESDDNKQ